MPTQQKSPAPMVVGNGAENNIQCEHNVRGTPPENQVAVRDVLLRECRAAVLRLRLAVTDIQVVGVSLRYGLINVEQAMELLNERDALDWLNLEQRAAP